MGTWPYTVMRGTANRSAICCTVRSPQSWSCCASVVCWAPPPISSATPPRTGSTSRTRMWRQSASYDQRAQQPGPPPGGLFPASPGRHRGRLCDRYERSILVYRQPAPLHSWQARAGRDEPRRGWAKARRGCSERPSGNNRGAFSCPGRAIPPIEGCRDTTAEALRARPGASGRRERAPSASGALRRHFLHSLAWHPHATPAAGEQCRARTGDADRPAQAVRRPGPARPAVAGSPLPALAIRPNR